MTKHNAAVAVHRRLPLMDKDVVADPKRSCPQVAMVLVDEGADFRSARNRRSRSKTVTGGSPKSRSWKPIKVRFMKPIPILTCRADFSRPEADQGDGAAGLGHTLPLGLEFGSA